MKQIRKLPAFEQTIGSVLLEIKEAVSAPVRLMLREFKISEQQWRIMHVINDRGAMDISGLAEIGHFHLPSVSRILQELVERQLVVRQQDERDRRRTLVTLTPEGHAVVKIISRQMTRLIQEYSHQFGIKRFDRLVDELRAFSSTIKSS